MRSLRSIIARPRKPIAPAMLARVPPGQRVYSIGDVHGRVDLFEQLLESIQTDADNRGPAESFLIILGDLINRGPDSARVLERVRCLKMRSTNVRVLSGNHEEVFLLALNGDMEALRLFTRIGGRETMLSYGITPEEYERTDFDELLALMQQVVPREHVAFLAELEEMITIGDYLFVHAGIRPGVPLEEQRGADLRWIRSEFLESSVSHGAVVIHGHTITSEVDRRPNRIGIDTGAWSSGVLSAIGLEDDRHWFLDTR